MSEKIFNPFGKESEQTPDAKNEQAVNYTVTVARYEYDKLQRVFNCFELMRKAWIEGDSFALDHIAGLIFGHKPPINKESEEN